MKYFNQYGERVKYIQGRWMTKRELDEDVRRLARKLAERYPELKKDLFTVSGES